jgi:hypothetical protein
MSDEQPRYFTLFDVFRELFHLGWIAAGCYVGWKIGENFLALFAGGVVGRIVGVGIVLTLLSLSRRSRTGVG